MSKFYLGVAVCVFSLISMGCGGSSGSSGSSGNSPIGGSSGGFTPASVQGQYEAVAQSTASPSSVALIESNFTQTGTDVFAGKASVVLVQGTLANGSITLHSLGGECDNGFLGNDSVQGTFTSATQFNFTLTEAGSLGTVAVTGSATVTPDGKQITSGTYSPPAACGFLADSGTVTGTKISPFSGSYAGMLANTTGTTNAVIVSVSQTGLSLTVTGTTNGTPFTMTGSVVGATFDVTGTIAGTPTENVGIYDHINNTFLVFDNTFKFLGTLKAGTNPQSIPVSAGFLKTAS